MSPTSSSPRPRRVWILFERINEGNEFLVLGAYSSEKAAYEYARNAGAQTPGPLIPGDEDSWQYEAFPYDLDEVLWEEGFKTV